MQTLELTQGYVAVVDDDDYERVAVHKWYAWVNFREDGTIRGVYARRTVKKDGRWTCDLLHRVIMEVADPDVQVDHENHDGLDNRRSNLRVCSNAQNVRHKRKQVNNSSGFKGVSWNRNAGKWHAQIMTNGRKLHLGYFVLPDDAARAYDSAARQLHQQFALCNFQEKSSAA